MDGKHMKLRSFQAIAAAAMLLVSANAPVHGVEAAKTEMAGQGPSVSVAPVKRMPFTETILVTSSLTARREVLVSPQVDGLRIVELLAEEGDRVVEGQVLARLERRTLEAQLAQLKATRSSADAAIAQARSKIKETEAAVKQAEAAFERAKGLVKSGTTSRAIFDQREAAARTAAAVAASAKDGLAVAQAGRAQVEAQIDESNLRLSFTEITAPSAGIISRRTAQLGAVAAASGKPLFRIVAKGEIELDAEIPEVYLPRVAPGHPARVQVAGLKERKGKVRLVGAEVDRATRLGRVRVFIGDDAQLRVGTFARGLIDTARREGLSVPSSAVLHKNGGQTVQVVKNGRVETRKVRTGMTRAERTEIIDGLKDGELVVLRSGSLLRDGDKVRPVRAARLTESGVE